MERSFLRASVQPPGALLLDTVPWPPRSVARSVSEQEPPYLSMSREEPAAPSGSPTEAAAVQPFSPRKRDSASTPLLKEHYPEQSLSMLAPPSLAEAEEAA